MILKLLGLKKISKPDRIFLNNLKKILGFKPDNIDLYRTAFIHSSASLGSKNAKINNERLEFIGDAVLNMVVADILYKKKPNEPEGKLSLLRSKIVCRKNLNEIASDIKLYDFLICKNTGSLSLNNISGNALESLFGAIYYDKNYEHCKLFAEKILLNDKILDKLSDDKEDFKSQIINFAQKNKIDFAFNTYENAEINEKTHHFKCELLMNNNYLSSGKGWSKKDAEQNCAKNALQIPFNKIIEIASGL